MQSNDTKQVAQSLLRIAKNLLALHVERTGLEDSTGVTASDLAVEDVFNRYQNVIKVTPVIRRALAVARRKVKPAARMKISGSSLRRAKMYMAEIGRATAAMTAEDRAVAYQCAAFQLMLDSLDAAKEAMDLDDTTSPQPIKQ